MKTLVRMDITFCLRYFQSVEQEKTCLGSQGDQRSRDGGQGGACRLAECRRIEVFGYHTRARLFIGAELYHVGNAAAG